jgi:hypothetical protein
LFGIHYLFLFISNKPRMGENTGHDNGLKFARQMHQANREKRYVGNQKFEMVFAAAQGLVLAMLLATTAKYYADQMNITSVETAQQLARAIFSEIGEQAEKKSDALYNGKGDLVPAWAAASLCAFTRHYPPNVVDCARAEATWRRRIAELTKPPHLGSVITPLPKETPAPTPYSTKPKNTPPPNPTQMSRGNLGQ